MSVLYFLESIRHPVLNFFFSVITLLGQETVFMAVGMIIFWCIDKYQGYYLLTAGFFGTVVNQFLKILCRIPRPWVKDPHFTVVESAKAGAPGYSFPSGHTQVSVGLFGGLARWNKQRILRILCIMACVLVPLSRMYLGVHTPLDVGVSVAIALLLIFGAYPLFKRAKTSPVIMYAILGILTACTVAFLLFTVFYSFPADTDLQNLGSARENAYTLLGCLVGLWLVYIVDLKLIRFPTEAVWWVQMIKVAGGLALVLLVKEVLRAPLQALCHGHMIARSIRYFFVVVTGGLLWPMTFKYFAGIGIKNKSMKTEQTDKQ